MAKAVSPKPNKKNFVVKFKWYDQPPRFEALRPYTLGFCLLVFIVLPFLSLKVGIPGDEPIDKSYGDAALRYYTSFGRDTSFSGLTVGEVKFPYQKYYGAGFEATSVATSRLLHTPVYPTRHVLTALAGATIILFTALLASELYGWLAALLAALLIAFSPTIIGHSLFNTKDIPMAMGFTIATYFFVRWIKRLPDLSLWAMIGSAIGIAIALGIRIGGLLLIPYLVFFVFIYLIMNADIRKTIFADKKRRIKFLLHIGFICIAGFLLGNLFYPDFFVAGFSHVSNALTIAKKFPVKIMMLYQGRSILSITAPTGYIPTYMVITFPLQVLAGLVLFVVAIPWLRRSIASWSLAILLFCSVFPVLYVIVTKANVYNGWRHVMFAYPVIVCCAAIGYSYIYSQIKKPVFKIAFLVILSAGILNTAAWIFQNNPYQYLYYNELVGGVKGIYGRYDTDYQQLATSLSYDWLVNSPEFKKNTSHPKRLSCNNRTSMVFNERLRKDDVILNTGGGYKDFTNIPWDFAIMSTLFMPSKVMLGYYPPKGTIHEEKVDGITISSVVNNENDDDLKALHFALQYNTDSALFYYNKACTYDPKNFRNWKTMGKCYGMKGDFSMALQYFNSFHELYPDDDETNDLIDKTMGFMNQSVPGNK